MTVMKRTVPTGRSTGRSSVASAYTAHMKAGRMPVKPQSPIAAAYAAQREAARRYSAGAHEFMGPGSARYVGAAE